MTDTPDNVTRLSDHQEPVVYYIAIQHGFDGNVQTFINGVDLSTMRSRLAIADGLRGLLEKLEDENRTFTEVPAEKVPS